MAGSSYAHPMRDAIVGDRIVKEKGWKRLGEAGLSQTDSVAEDTVGCEPVSAPNSLLTGKLTGISTYSESQQLF